MTHPTLTEFLSARIAEDEAAAKAAAVYGAAWHWDQGYGDLCNAPECAYGSLTAEGVGEYPTVIMEVHGYDVTEPWEGAAQIARNDPARVLAECAAKRAIIGQHADATSWDCTTDESRCPTLRALAAVYSDHPDFQPEWAL